jgi:hypothetical protein
MLARILPIIALVILCALGYFLYSQGTLQQIIRPTVVAVETKRQLIEGHKIRKNFIVVKDVSINRIEPGMITFPKGTTVEDVEAALTSQTVAMSVPKGHFLRSTMLGSSSNFVVLRARSDINEGESLTLKNIQATVLDGAPPGGVVAFDSEEEATIYISKAYDLTANKMIYSGQFLTIDDAAGGSSSVFVVRASRNFSRSERLSISGLETVEVSSKDMPSGAIAFQTRGAADVFIASSGKYILSKSIDQGETVVADAISADKVESGYETSDLPRTLAELTSYMKAYPDRAMFVDTSTYYGSRSIQEGDKVDIWVEESRTGGAFGQINLVRLDDAVLVRRAEDSSGSRDEQPAQIVTTVESSDMIGEKTETLVDRADDGDAEYLWVVMKPSVKKRFDAARDNVRAAFAVREGESMVDLMGNGAACLDGRCSVSRSASNDLEDVMNALMVDGEGDIIEEDLLQDPLFVMDGVSPTLQEKLRANGYDEFEKIASWDDEEIPAITIKLDISSNLAFYIREQARILASSADTATHDLGFDEAPQE